MNDKPRICADCKYGYFYAAMGPKGSEAGCLHPTVMGPETLDLTTGRRYHPYAHYGAEPARKKDGACGPSGKLWERRPTLREKLLNLSGRRQQPCR